MKNHLLALIVATSVAGCALPGERNRADGACPEGEVCSPDTPQGLSFRGPGKFDDFGGGPGRMVVGGTQRITVEDSESSELSLESFDADATDSLAIAEVAPPDVTVIAIGEGEGYLRILEPGTDDLYDRILLTAEAAKEVEMTPADSIWVDSELPLDGWSLFVGAPVDIGARILGSTSRLVDDSMSITASGATLPEEPSPRWDTATLVPDGSGDVVVTAKLGDGTAHAWTFPISEKVEKIVRITTVLSPDEGNLVTPGAAELFCFRALDGDLGIAGVPWTFTAEDDVTLDPMGSCVSVESKVTGDHVLLVKAGDAELAFDFEVAAGAGQKVMKPGAGRPTGAPASWTTSVYKPTPGDRARGE